VSETEGETSARSSAVEKLEQCAVQKPDERVKPVEHDSTHRHRLPLRRRRRRRRVYVHHVTGSDVSCRSRGSRLPLRRLRDRRSRPLAFFRPGAGSQLSPNLSRPTRLATLAAGFETVSSLQYRCARIDRCRAL